MSTMVIRVWHETAHENAFRARLTMNDDNGADSSIVSGDIEEVVAAVRDWLNSQRPSEVGAENLPV